MFVQRNGYILCVFVILQGVISGSSVMHASGRTGPYNCCSLLHKDMRKEKKKYREHTTGFHNYRSQYEAEENKKREIYLEQEMKKKEQEK